MMKEIKPILKPINHFGLLVEIYDSKARIITSS